ncbi:major facilitator superfamily domain-containing protein [Trametes polyzona]|nr:major facilitator superfamily domain-containing protein [Trametes polyzona]
MSALEPVAEEVLDETSPLLHGTASEAESEDLGIRRPTPLPKGQIAILMLLTLTEPITSHCIYPFINQLVSELDITGGDEKKVGYYAGMIESIFFAMEALFVFQWSRLSDRIGRKPVLLIGVGGLCLSMICFGLSKTFWGLVARKMTGCPFMLEIADETNIAQAFAWFPAAWSVGTTIGPLIGGQLAKPQSRWPNTFTHPFWAKYPYFLPCGVSAAFSIFTFIVTALFLKETVRKRSSSDPSLGDDAPQGHGQDQPNAPPPLRKVLTRRVIISVVNYMVLALVEIAYVALQPLFLATPVALGGLGLAPPSIGAILGLSGVLNGAFQRLFQLGYLAFVPLFLLFPVMSLYARAYGVTGVVWALVVLQQVLLVVMCQAFGAAFVFVRYSAASDRVLGATNGVAQFTASVMRAVGPAASTSLFAVSLEHNWLGGYGVYPILVVLTLALFYVSTYLPKEMWSQDTENRDD